MEQPDPFSSWLPPSSPREHQDARDATPDGALHLPKRVSLVDQTAATLKAWITSGMLLEVIPGELQLKRRLGVGRDTLRLALAILAREGWVTNPEKGCQRRVRSVPERKRSAAVMQQLPVTFLSPNAIETRVTLLEMQDTQTQLAAHGRHLRFVSPAALFQARNPERQLEQLVISNPSAAWVLFITNEAIQRWFEKRGIPAFLYELPYPGVNLPYVAPDWEGAAFHAALHLARNGHRLIGLLEFQERRPGIIADERGLERGLAAAGFGGRMIPFKDDRTPASVGRSLEIAFSLRERPTALVVSRASQLLTCYSWLAARGIRVPADVSLICLANDSWFTHLYPSITHYEPDSKLMSRSIAERVLDLVSTGQSQRKSMKIQLNFCPGGTVGTAPETGALLRSES
ncbi:MAG TPA: substrate-binding domain-containing protein [Verrucomicrobiae bacterium]|nr:substrate-binding domain-containing protein [Verrucomicrobiae bacterium]